MRTGKGSRCFHFVRQAAMRLSVRQITNGIRKVLSRCIKPSPNGLASRCKLAKPELVYDQTDSQVAKRLRI